MAISRKMSQNNEIRTFREVAIATKSAKAGKVIAK